MRRGDADGRALDEAGAAGRGVPAQGQDRTKGSTSHNLGDRLAASERGQVATPMHKPAEAAFHDPAAREHDKAFLSWVTFDHTMAHAVPVRPLVTGCSREGPVQDRLPQAGPRRLAWIKSLKRVAILHRGGDDRDGQPGAIGINQGHALAPEHLLSGIVPTWPAHRDALD